MVRKLSRIDEALEYNLVRIPDLTDAELLERDFVILAPQDLSIRDEPPPHDQWLTYEGRYQVGRELKCAFGHIHKRGYVFRDEAGNYYLIGNGCGASHFGMGGWRVFTQHRKLLEDRVSYLRELRDLHGLLSEHRAWIENLHKHPAFGAVDSLRSWLIVELPDLHRATRGVFDRLNGRIAISLPEPPDDTNQRRRGRAEKKVKNVSVILRGRVLFTGRSGSYVSTLRDTAIVVGSFLDHFSLPSTRKDLVTVSQNARRLIQNIVDARAAVVDALAFFDRDQLELFGAWADAEAFDDCSCRTIKNGLLFQRLYGMRELRFEKPRSLADIEDARFELLAARVSKFVKKGQKL